MATLNFYLKKANGKGTCPVIMVYQDRGQKFRYSTKITVLKELWDGSRIKGRSLEAMENNRRLAHLEQLIKDIELEALRKDCVYDIDTIETKLRWKLSEKEGSSDFFAYYDRFIETCRSTKTYATIKGYITLRNTLQKFSREKGIQVSFDSINQQFYDRLVNYFISDLGQLNNSIGKHIKNLKVFLNYVQHNELVNKNFKTKGFKVLREEIDIVALTEDELWKIYYTHDLPAHLDKVKDLFCFECFTGLRFSDIAS
jgi:hypothetical protein